MIAQISTIDCTDIYYLLIFSATIIEGAAAFLIEASSGIKNYYNFSREIVEAVPYRLRNTK